MSKIVIILEEPVDVQNAMRTLWQVSGMSMPDFKEAIELGEPIFEEVLYYNDHNDIDDSIRRLLPLLEKLGSPYGIYDLEEDEEDLDPDTNEEMKYGKITPEQLIGMLDQSRQL